MAIQTSNLPPSLVNEVVKIVDDETTVRSDLKSVSDVYSRIEEYGRTSDAKGIFDLLHHLEQGLCAGFEECDQERIQDWLECDVDDPGSQILADNEIIASVIYDQDPCDKVEETSDYDRAEKGPSR
ncbi:hypothetical protein AVEN_87072-1 [Araneus ventricosus]|uniref:Uncharacterized protein n=1 Tax=Araneus ventricosus TaxID=182803 RepID=A0A4Y2N2I0_ARAVE|nr:hypothetical protein AVEN_87072-1 [Araneus ventricosus]